ncbi:hypothetical protein, partial [Enterobacter sichuanensis]
RYAYPAWNSPRRPGKGYAPTGKKILMREPLVGSFLFSTGGVNRVKGGVEFLQEPIFIRTNPLNHNPGPSFLL